MKGFEDRASSRTHSTVTTLLIPAIINALVVLLMPRFSFWSKLEAEYVSPVGALITAIATVSVLWIVDWCQPQFRCFRSFGKYEGRWLQIIPDFEERPYSIIDFEYNKKLHRYEMHGVNFYKNIASGSITFVAYRFIERVFRNGFYYITNQTTEYKNGLGKLMFIKSASDKLTRAEGYFFDSSNGDSSIKYNTILIKCDREFFIHIHKSAYAFKKKSIPPREIMEASLEFALEEIAHYRTCHPTASAQSAENTLSSTNEVVQ